MLRVTCCNVPGYNKDITKEGWKTKDVQNDFPDQSISQFLANAFILYPLKTPGTMWKVSKYGVFSGPYFRVFGLNTEILWWSKSPYSVRIQENTDREKIRIWALFTQWGGIKRENWPEMGEPFSHKEEKY